jgi:2-aminomuconate deaminase
MEADSMNDTPHDAVRSTGAAESLGAYSHARRVGDLVFVAGIGPRRKGSRDIPGVVLDSSGSIVSYDIEAQIRSCFENIRVILEEVGTRFEHIIDVSVFMTDLSRDWSTYNRVYAEYFPPSRPQPTRTTVEVSALPQGGSAPIAFEAKVIAVMPPRA